MQILNIALLSILILMSLAAGVAKILVMPQELAFLSHLGMGESAVMILGIIQAAGGVLLVPPKTRRIGALLAIVALVVSALALFTSGNSGIGLITLFPIAIGVWVFVESKARLGTEES